MVEEAGGRSTNARGERTIYTGQLISTNGRIHEEVLKILREVRMLRVKRVYEKPTKEDGFAAGGSLWPRGMKKEARK